MITHCPECEKNFQIKQVKNGEEKEVTIGDIYCPKCGKKLN